ncbi:MAG TPA: thymidine phosphorylase [Anaerolineaceae bacterium]|uniref:Pyrimidine-nucleoside phosphorylase n=1 Tax=Anaerolinea thermophila TaxID=167964 RepID=A0A101FY75_9CHLR|nr:MAG: Pyrimidine-nucleoside phosphorylase [Anaerolinea thermophila]HAF62170.1 thymidine phosphorylase [Anaerolineaceae bacterium]
MRAIDIIVKKRDHEELSEDEIKFFVVGITSGSIPDYQISAWAMAVMLNGMSAQETTYLAWAMAHSGDILDLSFVAPIVVDKHSSGGVGDKTSLVVAPLVAACGLPVGKMSGRGLGFSGGTLDKMESIPGYRVDLTENEFIQQVKKIGIVLTGQTGDLAPADGVLYALRDVTGTVPSIPLIASSIMSKKIAAGAHAIVLDVKLGYGAFMKDLEHARELAQLMVEIGTLSGRNVRALLSDMNQPLGKAVGNAIELKEAIETLHGGGPEDFREHCFTVAAHMLLLGEKTGSLDDARKLAEETISDGKAWEKFKQLVQAQNGDVSFIEQPQKLPSATITEEIKAEQSGYLAMLNAQSIGEGAVVLGAGREKKGAPIDLGVGIYVEHKVGDKITKGDVLFTVYANDAAKLAAARVKLVESVTIQSEKCEPLPLFYGVI